MGVLETNIYPITNLAALPTRYRLVEVAGLRPEHSEYHQNRQALARKLSYSLRKPVLVIERKGVPYLVVPQDVVAVPSEIALVRAVVQLRPRDELLELDYTRRTPEDDLIALRFLRFLVQAPLRADRRLWQPAAGHPFFPRIASHSERGIDQYVGFAVRPMVTPDRGIGLCLDVTTCYVATRPLPKQMTREQFSTAWKGRNCVYRFGDDWYEIHLQALADLNAKEYRFLKDGTTWSLLDYVLAHNRRPMPSDLGNLSEDAAVVLYLDSRGKELGAPAPLCYPIFQTDSEEVARMHGRAIVPPHARRDLTHDFVREYMSSLRFDEATLCVSTDPMQTQQHEFRMPDLRFGNGVVLSARGTPGAIQASLTEFGPQRLRLLKDPTAGFYNSAPLDRQYIILPRSVHDTFGEQFVRDLRKTMDELYPQDGGFAPTVVSYDDRGEETFVRQALAIRGVAEAKCTQPGYALVMVHRTVDRRTREEDQLAAMVMREFRKRFDIRAAVIHSEFPRRAYREKRGANGQLEYRCASDMERRLSGYLRNVAITKVLLTNQRWPFILATPLHSDVTVGIDVKNNTAGLLVVGRQGSEIRSETHLSRQKERLLATQMATYLGDALRREAEMQSSPLATVVVHRDGRVWPSEIDGIRKAIGRLKSDGHLMSSARHAVIEISKSSPAPLRLYDVRQDGSGRPSIRNPLLGSAFRAGENEAYLCTTGAPYLRQGTARPLHLVLVDGGLSFEECLEDLHSLTALTWTQPEGCTRYPITIKLNDRILAAVAGEYNSDALEFTEDAATDEPMNGEGA